VDQFRGKQGGKRGIGGPAVGTHFGYPECFLTEKGGIYQFRNNGGRVRGLKALCASSTLEIAREGCRIRKKRCVFEGKISLSGGKTRIGKICKFGPGEKKID